MFVEPITSVSPGLVSPNLAHAAETVISVRGISKLYRIHDRPQDRLKQMLLRGRRMYGREFWALRDISFELRKGEAVGIIGRNGSGKSTLLQIIAGTLAPSQGEVTVNGRVAALLELGSGFNPEFTGRENVFLNGSILGLSREEMQRRFDEIVAFADIGEFINQPVKTYSSGMMVRLAFAVQASVEPDILIIDEALAVGDIFFRQKCYQRLESLRARGASILLVSHSMPDIEQLCERALLLDHGGVLFHGAASEAVKRYYLLEQRERLAKQEPSLNHISWPQEALGQEDHELFWPSPEAFLDTAQIAQVSNGWARCTGVALCDSQGQPCHAFEQGEMASFFYEFELLQDIDVPIGGVVLQNEKGVLVHGKNTLQYGSDVPSHVQQGSRIRFQQNIMLEIAPGDYTFEVGLATLGRDIYYNLQAYTLQEIYANIMRLCHLPAIARFAVVLRRGASPIELLHHGMANLPGDCRSHVVSMDESAHQET
jgi:lipopolysaccharide transport system ATP-binding protein